MQRKQPRELLPHLIKHQCELSIIRDGLAKLPPNAPLIRRICRRFRKFISPSPHLAISGRNHRNTSQIFAEGRRHAKSQFFYVIHPYSYMELYRELIFLVIIIWKIVMAPLFASFKWVTLNLPHPDMPIRGYAAVQYVELVVFALGVIWIVTCFFAGYKEGTGKLAIQLNHLKIARRYAIRYFLIDIMAFYPPNEWIYFWPWIYWLNLAAVFRCPTVLSFLERFLQDLRVPQDIIIVLLLLFLSLFFNHIFACLYYVVPLMAHGDGKDLWVIDVGLHPEKPMGVIYCGCFSMVQLHFWGLGESSKLIASRMEEFILTVVMIFGRLWSLFVLAAILRVFTISSLSESKYEQYLKQLQTFIVHNNMNKEMEERLLKYYEYTFQHHFFNERSIFGAMSQYLRQEVTLFRAKNVINKVAIFKYFPRSMIASIIGKCKILVFMNNDFFLKAGDVMNHVYFISWGTIAVFNEDGIELIHLSDGDEVGISGVTTMTDVEYKFAYISIETTEVYAITTKDFRAIVYSKPDVLKFFQRKVEERAELWRKIEDIATTQGVDLMSELKNEKLLERPRIRTRVFE